MLDNITDSKDMNLSKFLEMVKDREACVLQSTGLQRVGHSLVTEQQQQTQQHNVKHCLVTCSVLYLLQDPSFPVSSLSF